MEPNLKPPLKDTSDASNGSSLFHKNVDFHPSKVSSSTVTIGGVEFHLENRNPNSDNTQRDTSAITFPSPPRKIAENGDLDPELSFRIKFRRIGAGLENLRNTCFLNSVLQCLTYTEPFAAYLLSGRHKTSWDPYVSFTDPMFISVKTVAGSHFLATLRDQRNCHTTGFCSMCVIQNHVSLALQSNGRILSPEGFVRNLSCISRNFCHGRQEDAHEYMVSLLQSMHICCLPSGLPIECPDAYEKSLVHKVFGGRLRSQVKCLQCSYCSNKYDPFLDLSLDIFKADSLHRALVGFTAVEQLDGGDVQYQCQGCKQKVRAIKQLRIDKAPFVLIVHLKRFSSFFPGQKIDNKVDFAPTLNLKPFVSDIHEGDLKYTLYAVLVHSGRTVDSGHYFCFVRMSSGAWYYLDDEEVALVSEKMVFSQKAYMLLYVRDRRNLTPKKLVDVSKENSLVNPTECKEQPVSFLRFDEKIHKDLMTKGLSSSRCSLMAKINAARNGLSKELTPQKAANSEGSLTSKVLTLSEEPLQETSSKVGSVLVEEPLLETFPKVMNKDSVHPSSSDHLVANRSAQSAFSVMKDGDTGCCPTVTTSGTNINLISEHVSIVDRFSSQNTDPVKIAANKSSVQLEDPILENSVNEQPILTEEPTLETFPKVVNKESVQPLSSDHLVANGFQQSDLSITKDGDLTGCCPTVATSGTNTNPISEHGIIVDNFSKSVATPFDCNLPQNTDPEKITTNKSSVQLEDPVLENSLNEGLVLTEETLLETFPKVVNKKLVQPFCSGHLVANGFPQSTSSVIKDGDYTGCCPTDATSGTNTNPMSVHEIIVDDFSKPGATPFNCIVPQNSDPEKITEEKSSVLLEDPLLENFLKEGPVLTVEPLLETFLKEVVKLPVQPSCSDHLVADDLPQSASTEGAVLTEEIPSETFSKEVVNEVRVPSSSDHFVAADLPQSASSVVECGDYPTITINGAYTNPVNEHGDMADNLAEAVGTSLDCNVPCISGPKRVSTEKAFSLLEDPLLETSLGSVLIKEPLLETSLNKVVNEVVVQTSTSDHLVADVLPQSACSGVEDGDTWCRSTFATIGSKTDLSNEHGRLVDNCSEPVATLLDFHVPQNSGPEKVAAEKSTHEGVSVKETLLEEASLEGASALKEMEINSLCLPDQSCNEETQRLDGDISNHNCQNSVENGSSSIGIKSVAIQPNVENENENENEHKNHRHQKVFKPRNKFNKFKVTSTRFFLNLLFRATTNLRKKKKYKRSKPCSLEFRTTLKDSISEGFEPSTSKKIRTDASDSTCFGNESSLTEIKSVDISSQPTLENEFDHGNHRRHLKLLKPKNNFRKFKVASMHFFLNLLFEATMRTQKKKNYKRSKPRSLEFWNPTPGDPISKGFKPSTSKKTRKDASHSTHFGTKSAKRKARGCSVARNAIESSDDSATQNLKGSFRERIVHESTVLATSETPTASSSSALAKNQWYSRESGISRSSQDSFMRILTRGLQETTVSHWYTMELPPSEVSELRDAQSIGYVSDEWDEEYNRGKGIKVRSLKKAFDGQIPSQEIGNGKNQSKRVKTDNIATTATGNTQLKKSQDGQE